MFSSAHAFLNDYASLACKGILYNYKYFLGDLDSSLNKIA